MESIVTGLIIILIGFLGIGWLVSRESPETKSAREDATKWNNHEKSEWIIISLNQMPKLLKHNLDIKDKTQISHFRKAVDLFNQLEELGFIDDLKKHGNKFTLYLDVKRYPFEGFPNVTIAEGLTGTTFSYLIISVLRVICPSLHEEEIKQRQEILKLINEIKKSNIQLSKENSELFAKSAEQIIVELKY